MQVSTTGSQNSVPLNRILLGLALIVIAVCGTMFGLIVTTQANRVQGMPNPTSPLVGTWKSDKGGVVNYRPDGTARYRGSGTKVHYFEWNLDESHELCTYHVVSSQPAAWKSHLHKWILGHDGPEDRCEVIDMSTTGFKLRTSTADVLIYTPTTDTALETAP